MELKIEIETIEKEDKKKQKEEGKLSNVIPFSDDEECCPFCKSSRTIYRNEPIFGFKEVKNEIKCIDGTK